MRSDECLFLSSYNIYLTHRYEDIYDLAIWNIFYVSFILKCCRLGAVIVISASAGYLSYLEEREEKHEDQPFIIPSKVIS